MTTPNASPPLGDQSLSDAERRLLAAVTTGAFVDLQVGNAELDNPAQAAAWGHDRTVRAELLADLLTGERPARVASCELSACAAPASPGRSTWKPAQSSASCRCGTAISSRQSTSATPPRLAIRMTGCYLPALAAGALRTTGDVQLSRGFSICGDADLSGAHIGGYLDLRGANLANGNGPALSADGITVDQSMLCEDFSARGEVRLVRAHISGSFDLSGASLDKENGTALSAEWVTVGGGMFGRKGFRALGLVNLEGADIGGQLDLTGANLANRNGTALNAESITVGQNMTCEAGFSASGEVSLIGAHIGGRLSLTGAKLANGSGTALNAESITVGQNMTCEAGFSASGEVSLIRAHIGGRLSLTGASLVNGNGRALSADGIVGQDIVGRKRFRARGEVRLVGAHIDGTLDLDGASLANANGIALLLYGITVGQDILGRNLRARGEVRLVGANIGGQLDLTGANLANRNGTALRAELITVGQGMFCGEGFRARGQVSLGGAHLGGQLYFGGASLANGKGPALLAERLTVGLNMLCGEGFRVRGEVNLVDAQVGGFSDARSRLANENPSSRVCLRHLGNDRVTVQQRQRRREWLTRDTEGYVPQAYDQLATAYKNAGHDEWARRVAIAKQWKRRSALNPLNWLWYLTVGYGYRTWLAGLWLVVCLAIGNRVFSRAHMIAITTHPPTFHPLAYTADVILPIVSLGRKERLATTRHCFVLVVDADRGGMDTHHALWSPGLTGILKRD